MFNRKNPLDDPKLQFAIDDALGSLQTRDPDSKEYAAVVDQVVKLYSVKPKNDKISKDALVTVAANLFGILMIVGYERANVVTSKAMGFVQKLR